MSAWEYVLWTWGIASLVCCLVFIPCVWRIERAEHDDEPDEHAAPFLDRSGK
jgi:cyanate permease